jgi:hypothetical protein
MLLSICLNFSMIIITLMFSSVSTLSDCTALDIIYCRENAPIGQKYIGCEIFFGHYHCLYNDIL